MGGRRWQTIGSTAAPGNCARSQSVRYEELRACWEYAGGTVRSTGGSHHVFRFGPARVTVPFRRPILRRVYVEAALDALEEALE